MKKADIELRKTQFDIQDLKLKKKGKEEIAGLYINEISYWSSYNLVYLAEISMPDY